MYPSKEITQGKCTEKFQDLPRLFTQCFIFYRRLTHSKQITQHPCTCNHALIATWMVSIEVPRAVSVPKKFILEESWSSHLMDKNMTKYANIPSVSHQLYSISINCRMFFWHLIPIPVVQLPKPCGSAKVEWHLNVDECWWIMKFVQGSFNSCFWFP